MVVCVSKKTEQLEKELQSLKGELDQLISKKETIPPESTVPTLIKYMIEERERTNSLLTSITGKIGKLEKEIERLYDEPAYKEGQYSMEVPLSSLDAKILDFVQTHGMICADDLMKAMNYKGRNAACARMNKLYREGLLERYQLGHKVFYKFDAGKTTNTLIISPPQ